MDEEPSNVANSIEIKGLRGFGTGDLANRVRTLENVLLLVIDLLELHGISLEELPNV